METQSKNWRTPFVLLIAMAATMQIAFASWMNLSNNFAIEMIGFNGQDIGIQQSVREIPGFLSFAAIFFLFLMREQTLAYISLLLLGFAVAITGYFPSFYGFLLTTLISSIGFHYYETMNQSLTLQWLPKKTAPAQMGKILAVGSFAQLAAYGLVFVLWTFFDFDFTQTFLLVGGLSVGGTALLFFIFPYFKGHTEQHKKLVLRKRYWLYYALTFMGGARRQIFIVFAAFMMVERFGFKVHEVAALFLANGILTMIFAPMVGKWIVRFGERKILLIEYVGLLMVFTGYAFVSNPWVAVGLYIADHMLFSMAISMKTYFQKIADPADIAPTAGVAFTINHIAAVFIPVGFGFLWLISPAAVFLCGSAMAVVSFGLAMLVPRHPHPGTEFRWLEQPVSP